MLGSSAFSSRKGLLYVDNVSAVDLAMKYGTPLFVTSEQRLVENCDRIRSAFRRHYDNFELHYAIKSNPNLTLLSLLRRNGVGADAASPGEIEIAKRAGMKKEDIIFTGNYATKEQLEFAIRETGTVNFDDIGQYQIVSGKKIDRVSFRLNPGFGKGEFPGIVTAGPDAKFGIPPDKIAIGYVMAKKNGVTRFGLHAMCGSNVLEPAYFESITSKIMDIAGEIARKAGITFEFIDIGGGFGVPYRDGQKSLDIEMTAELVARVFVEKCREHNLGSPALMIEPGRYIVADTTVLLGSVTHVKRYEKTFVGTDVGMNVLIRVPLYHAFHRIELANRMDARKSETVNVVGQICENTDRIATDIPFPKAVTGDIVAIFEAGAYTFGMSSQYNSIPRPAEVLITSEGKEKLIRRRETIEDVIGTMPRS